MPEVTRYKRSTPRGFDRSIPRAHPTSFARSVAGVEPVRARDPMNGETYDANAIRCYNCGAPIENRTAESVCWLCGSDNFEGAVRPLR